MSGMEVDACIDIEGEKKREEEVEEEREGLGQLAASILEAQREAEREAGDVAAGKR